MSVEPKGLGGAAASTPAKAARVSAPAKRGRDPWATRLAIFSTLLLLGALGIPPLRSLFAFIAICLMIVGIVLEWRARRAGTRPPDEQATTARQQAAGPPSPRTPTPPRSARSSSRAAHRRRRKRRARH